MVLSPDKKNTKMLRCDVKERQTYSGICNIGSDFHARSVSVA